MQQRQTFLIVLLLGIMNGCGGGGYSVYPVVTGFHAPGEQFSYVLRDSSGRETPVQPGTYVVWVNHAGVEHYLTGQLLAYGYTVLERSRLQQILNEQNLRISLAATSDQLNEEVVKAGKLAGATHVIFADVRPQSSLYTASVAIRSVQVDTGQVRWSGTAHFGQPVAEPDGGVLMLAHWAVNRAVCRVEDGWTWRDSAEGAMGGCFEQDWRKAKREHYKWLMTEMQWLQTEKSALDQQRIVVNAEQNPVNRQRLLVDYQQRLAAYEQRVKVYNQRNAEMASQKEK